jgi:CRP-like cAMP-binding protein
MIDSFVGQLSVFQGFDPNQLDLLKPLFTLFYVPRGTVLFEQGDPADCLYILAGGEVAIRYKPEDGPPLVIAHVRAEGVIGWSAAIGNPNYTSSVVCTTDCEILRLRSTALRQLYEADPITGSMFLERLAALIEDRLRSNHPQLMALLEQGLTIKLDHPVKAG